jgi:hypothetical protein
LIRVPTRQLSCRRRRAEIGLILRVVLARAAVRHLRGRTRSRNLPICTSEKFEDALLRKAPAETPAGRPPGGEALAECIRARSGPDGKTYVEALHRIATRPQESARNRIAAITILLDRGFGKAVQPVVGPPAEFDVSVFSDEELELAIARARKAAGEADP